MSSSARLRSRHLAPAALAVAVAAALLGALGWAPWGGGDVLRVLVVEVSVGVGAPEYVDPGLLTRAREGLGASDRLAVVAYADGAQLVQEPVEPDAVGRVSAGNLDRDAGELAAGLRAAAAIDARGRVREVWIATDGDVTGSDPAEAATALRRAGTARVRWLELEPAAPVSYVESLTAPAVVGPGSQFAVEARGVARQPSRVELRSDGEVLDVRTVTPGPFRVAFVRSVARAGLRRFDAVLTGSAAPAVGATVNAVRRDATLHVVPTGGTSATGTPGPAARVVRAEEADAALLAGARVVVLHDVVEALPPTFARELQAAVRAGAGLILVGGERLLTTPVPPDDWRSLSPLHPPDEPDTTPRLYVALDGSGSMAAPWDGGGPPRDDVVRSAARELLRRSGVGTRIALRRFDDQLRGPLEATLLALDATSVEELDATVRGWAPPRGGTEVLPVLAEARRVLGTGESAPRRLLLLTDGRTAEPPAELRRAVVALLDAGVGLTLVVPGRAADDGELGRLLTTEFTGDPRVQVRAVSRAEELAPEFRDVERTARLDELVVEDDTLGWTPDAPDALRGAPLASVGVRRALRLAGREDATVWARLRDGSPALAVRDQGLGRVVALAGRPGDARWWGDALGDSWSDDSALRRLVELADRGLAGRARVETLGDGRLRVFAWGGVRPVAVRALAPEGGSEAPLRALVPEAGGASVTELGGEPASAAGHELLDVAGETLLLVGADGKAGPEYGRARPVDRDRVRRLAEGDAGAAGPRRAPWAALTALLLLVWASLRSELLPRRRR